MAKTKNLVEKILAFYAELKFPYRLPAGISVMNPYRENAAVPAIMDAFYHRFYNDKNTRSMIFGINPGRLGAGATGIPFTDSKRLQSVCGIEAQGIQTHEPSSVFIYEMIAAYGGAPAFYSDYYITSISPLGFLKEKNGRSVNYNYYDDKALEKSVRPFAITCIETQIGFGMKTDRAYCLGTGKNYHFLKALNDEKKYFGEIIPLEHPRFVMQYKSKVMREYVDKYLEAFVGEK